MSTKEFEIQTDDAIWTILFERGIPTEIVCSPLANVKPRSLIVGELSEAKIQQLIQCVNGSKEE